VLKQLNEQVIFSSIEERFINKKTPPTTARLKVKHLQQLIHLQTTQSHSWLLPTSQNTPSLTPPLQAPTITLNPVIIILPTLNLHLPQNPTEPTTVIRTPTRNLIQVKLPTQSVACERGQSSQANAGIHR
jgi:hypothetical protein